MFGLSFGEVVVIAILALVVLGPKELPSLLRTLGRSIAKLKRMSSDLRQQSGIDEIIREEGLQEELATLRALRNMSASGALESFIESSSNAKKAATLAAVAAAAPEDDSLYAPDAPAPELPPFELDGTPPDPLVEYPEEGCDAYGAMPAESASAQSGADQESPVPQVERDGAQAAATEATA